MPDISEETITCHSPAMGKDTAKKSPVDIPAWKFHACRHAILAVLDEGGDYRLGRSLPQC